MHTKYNITKFLFLLFSLFILFPLVAINVLAETSENVVEPPTAVPSIFVGNPMECSKNLLPGITKDCCSNKEYSLEGKLITCAEEERELAKNKLSGKTIYIGEYCYNKIAGICTSFHEVYCAFDSRIAAIVQSGGRYKQLGISFGDATNPNCRGITHDELLKINFDAVDYSKFCTEMNKKIYEGILQEEEFKQKIYEYACEAALKEKEEKKEKQDVLFPKSPGV